MPGNESSYPSDWLALAERDWTRATKNVDEDAFVERYPLVVLGAITEADVREALEKTKGLVELLKNNIGAG